MAQDRHVSDRDRLLVARISGIARRHARWGQLTETQKTAGAAELREVASGRSDLLSEEAGIALGTSRDKGPARAVPGRPEEDDLPNSSQNDDSSHPQRRMRAVSEASELALHRWAILGSNQ